MHKPWSCYSYFAVKWKLTVSMQKLSCTKIIFNLPSPQSVTAIFYHAYITVKLFPLCNSF